MPRQPSPPREFYSLSRRLPHLLTLNALPCLLCSMTSPPPYRTYASQIPVIAVLRSQLDQHDTSPLGKVFMPTLNAFRLGYQLPDDFVVSDLQDWYDPEIHEVLNDMATVFLDDQGNGPKFWPADPAARNYSQKLQYPTHEKEYVSVPFFLREIHKSKSPTVGRSYSPGHPTKLTPVAYKYPCC